MKTVQKHRFVVYVVIIIALLAIDVVNARRQSVSNGKWCLESEFDGLKKLTTTRVSIVRSDDTALPNPTPQNDSDISYSQIEDMTRRAIDLAGGLQDLVKQGDKVLIKPNIIRPEKSRIGGVTNVRVVKAVVRLVNEIAPGQLDIVIGEGCPYPMDYDVHYSLSDKPQWVKLWDVPGYQDLITDPDLEGINFRLLDINGPWEDLVYAEIPGGGYADCHNGMMWIHKEVLNADVHISVPVMKTHTTGITLALKNNIGLYPSTKYGFHKQLGVPQNNISTFLWHQQYPQEWREEEIVDAVIMGGIDFVVVDALACLEGINAPRISNGVVTNQVRMNMILAGTDMVAVDHVSARLMGLNPDDIAHIALAEKAGLGVNDPDNIEVVGSTIEESWKRFQKTSNSLGHFGTSNRTWLLKGPFNTDGIESPMAYEYLEDEAALVPEAGKDEWSEAIYFFDERIDIGAFYGIQDNPSVAYAFTYFDAPETQSTKFRIGSDELMRIYLNGEIVYDYKYSRTFDQTTAANHSFTCDVKEGENTLLVKVYQSKGDFQFGLNITEPETNTKYDSNRVSGLKFRTAPKDLTTVESPSSPVPQEIALGQNYPNPFNGNTVIPYELPESSYNEQVTLEIYNVQGQLIRSLVDRPVNSGHHMAVWDGRDDTGRMTASGIYLSRLTWKGHQQVRKMLFVR